MKYVVNNDPNYHFEHFGLADIARMQALDPWKISTFSGNLSAFRAHRGKLIVYHRRADVCVAFMIWAACRPDDDLCREGRSFGKHKSPV